MREYLKFLERPGKSFHWKSLRTATPRHLTIDISMTTAAEQALIEPESELDYIRKINEAIANNTTAAEIRISRIGIAQPLTPECAKQMPGWKPGMLFDNLTRDILTREILPPWLVEKGVKADELKPVHCMPVAFNFKLPSEYIEWNSKDAQKAGADRWKFKTLDPKDPRVIPGVWKSHGGTFEGKKPPVTINTNYLVLPLDLELRIPNGYFRVNTLSRSSAGLGSTIAGILLAHKAQNIKPWDRVYWLYTQRFDEPETHYVMQIARGPLLKDVAEPFVSDMCLDMGKSLVGPSGELFQVMVINSANLDGDTDPLSTGNPADPATQQSAADDPFAEPGAGSGAGSTPASF